MERTGGVGARDARGSFTRVRSAVDASGENGSVVGLHACGLQRGCAA